MRLLWDEWETNNSEIREVANQILMIPEAKKSNQENPAEVIKIFAQRGGIEAMYGVGSSWFWWARDYGKVYSVVCLLLIAHPTRSAIALEKLLETEK